NSSPGRAEPSSPISARAASCDGESSGLAGADMFVPPGMANGAQADESCRLGSGRRPRLAPVANEVPLGKVPTVNLDERVKVAERGDHDFAVASEPEQVDRCGFCHTVDGGVPTGPAASAGAVTPRRDVSPGGVR